MGNTLVFYFDFVSPYSYLAHTQLPELLSETGASLEYVPVFLGGLHQAQEITSPPFIPSKAKWIVRDCHMWADHYGLSLNWPKQFPFNTISLLRVCAYLQKTEPERVSNFINKTFCAIWEQGLDCSDQEQVSSHLQLLGLNVEEILTAIKDPEIKQVLTDNGVLSVKKEMFGLPVFEVKDSLYFGQDRLHFVKRALLGSPFSDKKIE